MRRQSIKERGISTLELAVAFPILFGLAIGITFVGRVFQAKHALDVGVRSALRCVFPTDAPCVETSLEAARLDWYYRDPLLKPYGEMVSYQADAYWLDLPGKRLSDFRVDALKSVSGRIPRYDVAAVKPEYPLEYRKDILLVEADKPWVGGPDKEHAKFYLPTDHRAEYDSGLMQEISGGLTVSQSKLGQGLKVLTRNPSVLNGTYTECRFTEALSKARGLVAYEFALKRKDKLTQFFGRAKTESFLSALALEVSRDLYNVEEERDDRWKCSVDEMQKEFEGVLFVEGTATGVGAMELYVDGISYGGRQFSAGTANLMPRGSTVDDVANHLRPEEWLQLEKILKKSGSGSGELEDAWAYFKDDYEQELAKKKKAIGGDENVSYRVRLPYNTEFEIRVVLDKASSTADASWTLTKATLVYPKLGREEKWSSCDSGGISKVLALSIQSSESSLAQHCRIDPLKFGKPAPVPVAYRLGAPVVSPGNSRSKSGVQTEKLEEVLPLLGITDPKEYGDWEVSTSDRSVGLGAVACPAGSIGQGLLVPVAPVSNEAALREEAGRRCPYPAEAIPEEVRSLPIRDYQWEVKNEAILNSDGSRYEVNFLKDLCTKQEPAEWYPGLPNAKLNPAPKVTEYRERLYTGEVSPERKKVDEKTEYGCFAVGHKRLKKGEKEKKEESFFDKSYLMRKGVCWEDGVREAARKEVGGNAYVEVGQEIEKEIELTLEMVSGDQGGGCGLNFRWEDQGGEKDWKYLGEYAGGRRPEACSEGPKNRVCEPRGVADSGSGPKAIVDKEAAERYGMRAVSAMFPDGKLCSRDVSDERYCVNFEIEREAEDEVSGTRAMYRAEASVVVPFLGQNIKVKTETRHVAELGFAKER